MTPQEFKTYLFFASVLAAVIGLVNMLRPARRWLGAGGVAFAIAAMLYGGGFPLAVVGVCCVFGIFCLAKDFGSRVGRTA